MRPPGRCRALALSRRLADERGGQVVLLSHCLLNENTRYLGGAGRAGCVREIVDACAAEGLGMVQMPCPEEAAWGGVLKRRLLFAYGSRRWLPRPLRSLLLRAVLTYTGLVYRRLARQTARRVVDYLDSGLHVAAIVGVDGSPSCGLTRTMNMPVALDGLCEVHRDTITVDEMNQIVRDARTEGRGLYTEAIQRQLHQRGLLVPYLAHDLFAELDGQSSTAVAGLVNPASPLVTEQSVSGLKKPSSSRTRQQPGRRRDGI